MQRHRDTLIRWYAIGGSILIHLLGVALILSHRIAPLEVPATIEVTIEPPPKIPSANQAERQIVSPSEAPRKDPPPDTQRLSEVNSATEIEKIKRGDSGGIPGPEARSNAQAPQNQQKPQPHPVKEQAKPPRPKSSQDVTHKAEKQSGAESKAPTDQKPTTPQHLTSLRLDESTLEEKFGVASQKDGARKAEKAPAQSSPQQELSQYRAFSRPPGSGAAFLGTGGLSDHLPNLPDGDITLLNAKANQYAGFVRRVAVQVFSQLRNRGWENLTASEVRRIGDFTTVEAVLSKQGELLGVRLVESSGSSFFDEILGASAKSGARDPNPPAGAEAADGKIHFIFKARSWSNVGMNPRNGAPFERRWILLATGLE